jgi:uncharacterized protein DUF4381
VNPAPDALAAPTPNALAAAPTSDALAALRDIHLPASVPLWPPAPAWWIVAALALAAAFGLAWWLRARWRSPRRAARQELDALARAYAEGRDVAGLAQDLSALLRRVALARHPREEVAALHGARWLEFLEANARGGFPRDVAEALEAALYRQAQPGASGAHEREQVERWLGAVRRWIGAAA